MAEPRVVIRAEAGSRVSNVTVGGTRIDIGDVIIVDDEGRTLTIQIGRGLTPWSRVRLALKAFWWALTTKTK